jgi:hypothetical protein
MPSAAVGDSPVEFTDTNGNQVSIPLSALEFDANNNLTVTGWPGYTTYKAQVDPYLQYLAAAGAIRAAPVAVTTSKPAMVISAADPGSAGNNLQVAFGNITPDPANPDDATKTTFDATITEQESYKQLGVDANAPNFVKKVLGTQTITGSQPGAVHVHDADTPTLPKAGIYPLGGGGNNANSAANIPANTGGGEAFTVEARKSGGDGDATTVTIADVDTQANTFSLTTAWSQNVTGIKLADLPGKLQGNSYAISVAPPTSGSFAVPAAGKSGLLGGADAQAAQAAKTTVPAG